MGGVQKRRTLIVSKLESFYGAGGGGLTLACGLAQGSALKPHWGFIHSRARFESFIR
jgi:hypothetical protein